MDSVRNKACYAKAEVTLPGKAIDKTRSVPDIEYPAVKISAGNSENDKLPFFLKATGFRKKARNKTD